MTDGSARKLIVEICSAKNLMPKDGQGTASAYVIVDFDGQRRRTATRHRDLNPRWDERLEFSVHDPASLPAETLEVNVYNDKKAGKRSTFLGKVKIAGASVVAAGSESLVHYPLEKRSVFSQVKGEIGLKVSYLDESPPPPDPKVEVPAEEKKVEVVPAAEEKKDAPPETGEEPKEEEEKPKEEKQDQKPLLPNGEEKEKELPIVAASTPSKESSSNRSRFGDLEARSNQRAGVISYDLVERVPYLFVRVLKARSGSSSDAERLLTAKITVGSHCVKTKSTKQGEWDQTFAFHKESLNSTTLEVSVCEEKNEKKEGEEAATLVESSLGLVSFDLHELPKRSPPDCPLAPQWYTLEASSEGNEVMLAVWIGNQADEAFQEAWQSDSGGLIVHTRSKAYLSPKLWYLRLTIIQTQDLQLSIAPDPKKLPGPELYIKAQLGSQVFKTGKAPLCSSSASANPCWNEDLVFVAAEPFDPFLTIFVEDATNGKPIGNSKLPLSSIYRRVDDRAEPPSCWLNLAGDAARPYAGRVHVLACLEGGYHVLDEAAPVSKQLSKPPVGLLEVGVRGAANLVPMKLAKDASSGSTDAYVVLKYGPKWVRTRTVLDQFNPRWNEQYSWDVFDPCTALTVAVFDNVRCRDGDKKDARIGKVRIRLSTLDTNRAYLNTYPLTAVTPFGAKKMGELELAIRLTCSSYLSLVQTYARPMLPRMHYVRPLSPAQQDLLRHTAVRIVSARLSRSEPPLSQEVIQHVLDTDSHVWSMRRSKASWFRIVTCLSRAAALAKWVHGVRLWTHPSTTVLVHVILLVAVLCPNMILPTVFLYLFLILVWRYRARPREPVGMDPRLSHVDAVGLDELDEEFDPFPSARANEVVRARYDRLRVLAGRAQTLLGDVAAQGERVEALLNWRDPRATGMFAVACLSTSLVFYVVSFKGLVLGLGFYYLRHPKFRGDMPAMPFNFFRRLPSLSDRII